MNRNILKTCWLTGLLWSTVAVVAQEETQRPTAPSGEKWVARLDTDQDQRVSAAEFDGPPEHFTKLDRNADGFIEVAEAPKVRPPGPRPPGGGPKVFIERLDQDKDGKVSAAEFDGPPEHFSHFDRDQDGFITLEEAPKGPPPGRRPPPRQGN